MAGRSKRPVAQVQDRLVGCSRVRKRSKDSLQDDQNDFKKTAPKESEALRGITRHTPPMFHKGNDTTGGEQEGNIETGVQVPCGLICTVAHPREICMGVNSSTSCVGKYSSNSNGCYD